MSQKAIKICPIEEAIGRTCRTANGIQTGIFKNGHRMTVDIQATYDNCKTFSSMTMALTVVGQYGSEPQILAFIRPSSACKVTAQCSILVGDERELKELAALTQVTAELISHLKDVWVNTKP